MLEAALSSDVKRVDLRYGGGLAAPRCLGGGVREGSGILHVGAKSGYRTKGAYIPINAMSYLLTKVAFFLHCILDFQLDT